MGRPKNQDSRRAEILDAASLAIAEKGLTGLRIKHVAARAGLSAGLVSYYYPDLDELVVAVHQRAVDRFYRARHGAVQNATDPVDRIRRTVDLGIPDSASDDLCLVLYELHLHASRSAAHSVLMSTLFDLEVSLYETAIEVGRLQGLFSSMLPSTEIARNAVMLEDAYGLHIVGRNRSVSPSVARRAVLGYLSTALDFALVESEVL